MCSYLLINFWFTRLQAGKAALKAVFVNKIGDVGLFAALVLILNFSGTSDFNTVLSQVGSVKVNQVGCLLSVCLLLAVVAKSAQLFLHTWLPYAM